MKSAQHATSRLMNKMVVSSARTAVTELYHTQIRSKYNHKIIHLRNCKYIVTFISSLRTTGLEFAFLVKTTQGRSTY